jgi:hypothetical protein
MTHKNKITTGSYFIKRLRDSGFITIRLFKDYGIIDPRRWSIMVDPGGSSLIITCYENKDFRGEIIFEFNDGGNKFVKNFNLKIDFISITVAIGIEVYRSEAQYYCIRGDCHSLHVNH